MYRQNTPPVKATIHNFFLNFGRFPVSAIKNFRIGKILNK